MEDRNARFGIDPFRGQATQIWQGTILESGDVESIKRKLVISADCDLTEEKNNEEFFVLDVLKVEKFAYQLVAGEASSDLIAVLLQSARDTVCNRAPLFASVSNEVFCEWLLESTVGRWEADLPGLHANEKDWLHAIRDSVCRLSSRIDQSMHVKNEAELAILLACKNSQLAKQVDQLNRRLKTVLSSRLQPSRVDLYILPALPGDSSTAGHVVPFKSLTLMRREEVCLRRMELVERPGGFVPQATCRPVLLQSLLQKLMTYFVRIGLTNSFQTEQKAVINNLVESLR